MAIVDDYRYLYFRHQASLGQHGQQTRDRRWSGTWIQWRLEFATERFVAGASTAFAVLATGLAALGLYGVRAYSVAQRSREIGLRFTLGAPAGRMHGMVLRQVAGMVVIGVVLGATASSLLGRAARSVLFGVEAGNSLVALVLAAVAAVLAAVMLGVRRASIR